MKKQILLSILLLISSIFIAEKLPAGVNLKNGNFYISYTDHSLKETSGFEIVRTYNSKSVEIGLFGFGWGSEIETRLFLIGDGTVLIKEHGSGSNTFFDAVRLDEAQLAEAVNLITQAAIENGDLESNPAAINAYKQKLRNNREDRTTKWLKYLRSGFLKTHTAAIGTKWGSSDRGSQTVERMATGFKRNYSDGSYDLFNEMGLMTGRYKKDQQAQFTITYNNKQEIQDVVDRLGNKLSFRFDKNGFLTEIKSVQGTSYYTFAGENLVKTVDVEGNTYVHEYDAIHNMTAIRYTDGSAMLIEYYNNNYFVKSITERNGSKKEYVYVSFYTPEGAVNDDHYATYVIGENNYTGKIDSNYYEYEIKTRPDGARYTYRIMRRVNGQERETIYSENCNNPLRDRNGKRITTYAYNSFCFLVLKETDSYTARVTYDSLLRKIVRSEYINKRSGEKNIHTFQYNTNGDLIRADEDGKWVVLDYDSKGKISRMEYEEGVLRFEYNSIGKPSVIQMEGKGTLKVTYKSNGEIDKVDSEEGSSVSMAITQAFQMLLRRTKPQGLNFN